MAELERELSAAEMLEWIRFYSDEFPACPMLGAGAQRSAGQTPADHEAIIDGWAKHAGR